MKTATLLLLIPLSLVANGSEFEIIKKLPFVDSAPSLTLDLYLPEERVPPVPCVIVIQGGGFASQNGQRFKPFAEYLAEHGFAAALISYRGRPDHRYRTTMSDVRESVRFVRRNCDRYGVNPQLIGATGRSAGGTLAALLAVDNADTDPETQIQASVCFAGVFDFVSRFTDEQQLKLQPRHESKLKTNGEWIGPPFSKTNQDWLAASPVTHVDPSDPPILLLHSRDDSTVPWWQSGGMFEVLQKHNVAAKLKIYETGGHGVKPKDEDPMKEMVRFFRKHLSDVSEVIN